MKPIHFIHSLRPKHTAHSTHLTRSNGNLVLFDLLVQLVNLVVHVVNNLLVVFLLYFQLLDPFFLFLLLTMDACHKNIS